MKYDESYMRVAIDVLAELSRYTGYSYARGFTMPIDVEHLAFAIQRAVEHMQTGRCQHEEECKEEWIQSVDQLLAVLNRKRYD